MAKATVGAAKGMKIKNHVTKRGRTIQGQLAQKFGIHFDRLINACMGDAAANKEIGELGRQGRLMSEFAPMVKEKALEAIAGTQAFNEAIGEINIASGQAATAIDRVGDRVELSNIRFIDDRNLRQKDFVYQKAKLETNRKSAHDYLDLKNSIDMHMLSVDGSYKMLQLELQPEIRDNQLAEAHNVETAKYNLEMGNKAKNEHKPLKQYGGRGVVDTFKQMLFGE